MTIPMKLEKAMLVKTDAGLGGALAAVGSMAASAGAALGGIGGFLPMAWSLGEGFEFRFNPSELRESKTASFTEHPTSGATGTAPTAYNGTHAASLSFTVLLDEWEAPPGPLAKDVADMVKALCELTSPENKNDEASQPPQMTFVWGKYQFKGYIQSVNATYTLFRRDGSAARAEVQIAMKGSHEGARRQNPTSGGPSGRRTQQLIEGDTLQTVSFREYGDPNLWRAIADANGVDDPLAVAPGIHLLLPSKTDAQALR
jgi:hypothetical protein